MQIVGSLKIIVLIYAFLIATCNSLQPRSIHLGLIARVLFSLRYLRPVQRKFGFRKMRSEVNAAGFSGTWRYKTLLWLKWKIEWILKKII